MSLQDQIAADFLTFDGLETCYVYHVDANGTMDAGQQVSALGTRGQNETETDVGTIAAGRRTQVWHCRVRDVSGEVVPKDRLLSSDGQLWEIWFVQRQSLSQRYRMTCVELDSPVYP